MPTHNSLSTWSRWNRKPQPRSQRPQQARHHSSTRSQPSVNDYTEVAHRRGRTPYHSRRRSPTRTLNSLSHHDFVVEMSDLPMDVVVGVLASLHLGYKSPYQTRSGRDREGGEGCWNASPIGLDGRWRWLAMEVVGVVVLLASGLYICLDTLTVHIYLFPSQPYSLPAACLISMSCTSHRKCWWYSASVV